MGVSTVNVPVTEDRCKVLVWGLSNTTSSFLGQDIEILPAYILLISHVVTFMCCIPLYLSQTLIMDFFIILSRVCQLVFLGKQHTQQHDLDRSGECLSYIPFAPLVRYIKILKILIVICQGYLKLFAALLLPHQYAHGSL